ncbi:EF-hand domain-containing protein [Streptomyces sp. NPDC097619]|uniref:EF-hand domain-containing protein n=1 Tax=Streptomyces sp. NPDC097619 TaxID=3157228 RepID=UPI0033197B0F
MASEFQRRKVGLAFGMMDVDGDGHLTEADFALLAQRWSDLRAGGGDDTVVRGTMLGWWRTLSTAASGADRVTLEDVLGVVDALPAMPEAVHATAEAMFEVVDANGNGEVDRGEYKQMIEAFSGQGVDTDAAFDLLDLNGDGHLDREEFRAHWYEFWAGTDESAPGRLLFGRVEGF